MLKHLAVALALTIFTAASVSAQEPQRGGQFSRYLVGVVVAQLADNVSTQVAMAPYWDGTQYVAHTEVNPFLSSDRGANALVQGVGTIVVVVVLHRIEPSHPRLARVLALGLIGLGAQDTVHNVRRWPMRR